MENKKAGTENRDETIMQAQKMLAPSLHTEASMEAFRKLPLDAAVSVCGCADRILEAGYPQKENLTTEFGEALTLARRVVAEKLMAETEIWYMGDLATGRAFMDDDGCVWVFSSRERAEACAMACISEHGRRSLRAASAAATKDGYSVFAFWTYVCGARAFTLDVGGDELEFDPAELGAEYNPWGGPLTNPPILNPDLMRCLARICQDKAVSGKQAVRVAKRRRDALWHDAAEAFARVHLLVPAKTVGQETKVAVAREDGKTLLSVFTDDFAFQDACRNSHWTDAMVMTNAEFVHPNFPYQGIVVNPGSMGLVCSDREFQLLLNSGNTHTS